MQLVLHTAIGSYCIELNIYAGAALVHTAGRASYDTELSVQLVSIYN